ncbi:hypothetical protein [Methylobacterium sp. WL6]|uniref:hypothetical protein n=1 Tax=Methylobacterium sp. WL6 TaxID=2603901 RepID=UPI0011CABF96|nr:hypothetical protein [Methylobacterium sp. WL6]TXN73446.1 hypothetical protein FV230_01365 [Methylobacterium sp. WL6]
MIISDDDTDPAEIERQVRAALAAERVADRQGASAFAASCRVGDVDAMLRAADFLNDRTIDGWRLAMCRVGRLSAVSPEIRAAFLGIWIESKHMPLQVGHRPTMARALHVLMPSIVLAEPLRLFRGTSANERSRRLYGFSWSTQRNIAERFAEQARLGSGGAVLLETLAPIGSVHLRREHEGYYDEGEVVVNPYALERIEVVARFAKAETPSSLSRR